MSALSALPSAPPTPDANGVPVPLAEPLSDRRKDVDAKHAQIAALLEEVGCEALLVLDQANLAWLTSGATARSVLDPEELPGLFFTTTQRWLVSSNVESQRMFEEEMDELGFMLKEWQWHTGRSPMLADLCQNKAVASDVPFQDAKGFGDRLRQMRRILTPYDQACYSQLGRTLAHALEATCRHLNAGDTEREAAGHISHRLIHRGIVPAAISVAADGRSKRYRRAGYTAAPIQKYAVVSATARKFGLFAYASRSFSFGPVEDGLKKDHAAASRIAATYAASSWPDAIVKDIFHTARKAFQQAGCEHEWMLCPQGHLTGRIPVEIPFLPDGLEPLRPGQAVVWQPTVGLACSGDTYVVTSDGPQLITPAENWPHAKLEISGADIERPDVLER